MKIVREKLALMWVKQKGNSEIVTILEDSVAKNKTLYETLSFKRGIDPKTAMCIGLR